MSDLELDFVPFDADNHYYEALDAFTRHLDPSHGPRCVQWCEVEGRRYHVVGGRVCRIVANPTFDPIAKAGALHEYFRGNPTGRSPLEMLSEREPIRPEYRDRDARIEVLEQQGLDGCWLFPTLGVLYEEQLINDPEAVMLTFEAFNKWLEEDWGFAYQDKIFGAPYITLVDVDFAISQLEWALAAGARVIVLRPAAVFTKFGPKTPSDPYFDPFWSRVNEAGITVVVHAGDSGFSTNGYAEDAFSSNFGGGPWMPSVKSFQIERAAHDFLITLIFEKFFDRFPRIRVASVENGSGFLADTFRKLASQAEKTPTYFSENPVDTFKSNIWINPFWEDDVNEVVAHMGADRVIFGSDWPHIEGMPSPLDYVVELKEFSAEDQRKILRDNTVELTGPPSN